jgi:hypothetical protein
MSTIYSNIITRLSNLIVGAKDFCIRHFIFIASLFSTLIFYATSLMKGSKDAGFLYTGDMLGGVMPAVLKIYHLVSNHQFSGIDYSQLNGSVDNFLTVNFFSVSPLLIGSSIFLAPFDLGERSLNFLLVTLLAINSFLAFYFTVKLLTRFFKLELIYSLVAAFMFAFSIHMITSLNQATFVFSTALIPWIIYAALAYQSDKSYKNLFLGALPVILTFLGGYVPLALMALLISILFIVFYNFSKGFNHKSVNNFLISITPFLFGALIVSPYFMALLDFYRDSTANGRANISFSAHSLAELPQSFIRVISTKAFVHGPFYEMTLRFGLVPIAIIILFFFKDGAFKKLGLDKGLLLKFCAGVFFVLIFIQYGQYSVLSDMFYYFMPQIGGMHIYQRFLLPGQIFFAVGIALMLYGVVNNKQTSYIKYFILFTTAAILLMSFFVSRDPDFQSKYGLDNYFILELIALNVFLFSLLLPGKLFVSAVAIVAITMPSLDQMYDMTQYGNKYTQKKDQYGVRLNYDERAGLVRYLKSNYNKDVVKYFDLSVLWDEQGKEPLSKWFPYLVLNDINLASYSGFNFNMHSRRDYMTLLPMGPSGPPLLRHMPNWNYVLDAGADFVVLHKKQLDSGMLNSVEEYFDLLKIHTFPDNMMIVPTRKYKDSYYDNGYFSIERIRDSALNIALNKPIKQSSDSGLPNAFRAVDGNTDGFFGNNSVTHTNQDPNGWIEIDLEKSHDIDLIKVWNRTDCCGFRLKGYTIFIAEKPFGEKSSYKDLIEDPKIITIKGSDPADKMIHKLKDVRGRYVRIQYNPDLATKDQAYLSIAEIEVFKKDPHDHLNTNAPSVISNAIFDKSDPNNMSLIFDASAPARLSYQFWKNPNVSLFVNGEKVKAPQLGSERLSIIVEKGTHVVELKYRNTALSVFWIFYFLYFLGLVLIFCAPFKRKHFSGEGK